MINTQYFHSNKNIAIKKHTLHRAFTLETTKATVATKNATRNVYEQIEKKIPKIFYIDHIWSYLTIFGNIF